MESKSVFGMNYSLIIIFCVLTLILLACNSSTEKAIETATKTDAITSTVTIQPTTSPFTMVTVIVSPSLTVSPTPEPSYTPIPITLTPASNYLDQCFSLIDELPTDEKLSGRVAIDNYGCSRWSFIYDLENQQSHLFLPNIENCIWDMSVSPDGKWLAFTEGVFTSSKYMNDLKLQLVNSSGEFIDFSFWLADWQYILGWLDNERIALVIPGRPAGAITILNPFTGKHQEVLPTFDNTNLYSFLWKTTTTDIYVNPQLTHIAYFSIGDNDLPILNVWDIHDERIIWQGKTKPFSKWSPDGNILAAILASGQLIAIDLHGNQTTLIDLSKEDNLSQQYVQKFSWSPDGSRIAAWISDFREEKVNLAILDVTTEVLTNTCISTSNSYNLAPPLWSPNGKQLLFGAGQQRLMIVDLGKRWAKNSFSDFLNWSSTPKGWLIPEIP